MTRRIHWTATLSAIPLDEPDPREREVIRGRVVLMPKAWRRCASGVTFDHPPSVGERRAAATRLSAVEREVLAAIRGGAVRYDRGVGRKHINATLYNHPTPPQSYADRVTEAIDRLADIGAITIEQTRTGPLYLAAPPRDQEAA